MNVYLAGPINGCTDDEANTWREWFEGQVELSHDVTFRWINPMVRDYRGRECDSYREIVDLDKRDIESSDFLVVMYVKPSVGTSMEILWAWLAHKPIVVIDQSEKPLSPWMRYHCTAIVKTTDEALRKLRKWV